MAAEILTKFLADLVNATSDCVQAISDQCLAKGLITGSTYRRVLESGGTSEDKARTLILGVQKSTKTDGACFDILLEILDEQLPPASKQKLLLEMRKEHEERANSCLALVPAAHSAQQSTDPVDMPLTAASQQCVQQQSSLLGRYENSVSRLAYSSAQKNQFEETLQSRVEESRQLKDKLETLESQLEASSLASEKEMSLTKSRILACETEMNKLKRKIEELGGIIEEESMEAKRGRNTIRIGMKRLIDQAVQQSQQEIKRSRENFTEMLKSKEQAEQEAMTQRRMQEEANAKVRELELRLKLELQEKELKIKELELKNVRMGQGERPHYPPYETVPIHLTSGSSRLRLTMQTHGALVMQLASYATRWREIGTHLNFTQYELNNIESRLLHVTGAPLSWLDEMLSEWLRRAPGDSRGSTNFPSLEELQDALKKMGLGKAAQDLRL